MSRSTKFRVSLVAIVGVALAVVVWLVHATPLPPPTNAIDLAESTMPDVAPVGVGASLGAPLPAPALPVARQLVSAPSQASPQNVRAADTLVVRVVDFDGQPLAGVAVSIRLSAIDLRRRRIEALATTAGVHGECVVPQFARHVASIGVPPAERSNVVELLAHGPGWESPGVFVDATELPAAPIVLRAPPHGSVRVRLRDPTRVPAQQVVHATLEVLPLSHDLEQLTRQRRRERCLARPANVCSRQSAWVAPSGSPSRLGDPASARELMSGRQATSWTWLDLFATERSSTSCSTSHRAAPALSDG